MTQPVAEPSYDVARKGTSLGSYRLPEIASEIAAGKLLWTDDCWTEGMESWGKLADIKDLVESAASPSSRPNTASRLPLYVGVTGGSLLLAGALAFFLSSPDSAEVSAEAPAAPTSSVAAPSGIARDKPRQMSLSEIQDKVSMLVSSSFQMNKAENGTTTFSHRYYKGTGNRIPLRIEIDAEGRCQLLTFYQGKSWIFHRQLRFVIGKQTLETGVIEPHKRGRSIGDDNTVSETCRFATPDDAKLIGPLASAADSQITFHMVGLKTFETPLSFETKIAIKESYELSELLSKRRKLLEELGVRP